MDVKEDGQKTALNMLLPVVLHQANRTNTLGQQEIVEGTEESSGSTIMNITRWLANNWRSNYNTDQLLLLLMLIHGLT